MRWKLKDGEIVFNKSGFMFIGETAQKIMFKFQDVERKMPEVLKGREDEIRILTLNKVLKDKTIKCGCGASNLNCPNCGGSGILGFNV